MKIGWLLVNSPICTCQRGAEVRGLAAFPAGHESRVTNHESLLSPLRRGGGFTLVEILVVLLIAGLVIGLVAAIVQPNERALLRAEAERLARLLDLAVAESGLTGKAIGWTAEGAGYRFWRFREDTGWAEIRDSDLLRARTLPQGMTISGLSVESGRPQAVVRLEFRPYGPPPPFVIEMSLGAQRYGVAGSAMGEVRAVAGEDRTDG